MLKTSSSASGHSARQFSEADELDDMQGDCEHHPAFEGSRLALHMAGILEVLRQHNNMQSSDSARLRL